MRGNPILTGITLPVGLRKGILFGYDKDILPSSNRRRNRVILFTLPIEFTAHPILAYTRHCHFTE